jgi:DNA-binding MurR/RpiR family transcriptional regulator
VTTAKAAASGRTLQQRVADHCADLTPAERRVAEYLRDHPDQVVFASASELGTFTGTSDATVIRAARALGYSGLPELRHSLASAFAVLARPAAILHERIASMSHDPDALLGRVLDDAAEVLQEARRCLSPEAFHAAATLISSARECLTFGVGLSETVAEYLARRLNRLGIGARASRQMGFGMAEDLLPLGPGDVVVVFAPGRLLREIEVLIDHAQQVGAPVILVTDTLLPVLGGRAEVTLQAICSPAGQPGETFTATVISDALVLAIAAEHEQRAVEYSELLNKLRSRLLGTAE